MSSTMGRGVRVRTRHVVGEPQAVRAALVFARAEGRLVGVRDPARLVDGRVRITATLLEPHPTRARRIRITGLRLWLRAAGLAAAVAAGGAVVWLAVLALIALVTTVVAWVSAHWVAILVGLSLLLFLIGRGGRCAGLHCGGVP